MKALILAAAISIAAPAAVHAQYGGYRAPGGYGSPNPPGGYGTGANPYSHGVEGYTRQNGTYVAPHYETNPNSTQLDNYGTRGNQNPYTGSYGTRTPR